MGLTSRCRDRVIRVTLPPQADRYSAAINGALSAWFRCATVSAFLISGGQSGALVLRIELSLQANALVPAGEYILKVRTRAVGETSSAAAHLIASAAGPKFASQHMAVVVRQHEYSLGSSRVDVTLFSVAGGSLQRFRPCESPSSARLERASAAIIADVTEAWSAPGLVAEMTVYGALISFMGGQRMTDAVDKVGAFLPFKAQVDTRHGAIISPELFLKIIAPFDVPIPMMTALNHRDLRGGNILIGPTAGESVAEYFIIDFDESQVGLAGYDAAYLEVERFFRNCEGLDAGSVRGLISEDAATVQALIARADLASFVGIRDSIRQGEERVWANTEWEHIIRRQSMLARIAASLIWIRRDSIGRSAKVTLALYAGSQCALFLERYYGPSLAAVQTMFGADGKGQVQP